MNTVSLCMLVKNEAHNLLPCISGTWIGGRLFNEIILVDTGSQDSSLSAARQLGADVFNFPWNDSFAEARNECLKHATGDWIFWLDADDRIDEDTWNQLADLFEKLPDKNVAYIMPCHCLGTEEMVPHVRLFRRHPEARWQYRVHEQILPSLQQLDYELCWTDVTIEHVGYQDPEVYRKKLERNLRLLHLEDNENPCDPWILYNLAITKQKLGQKKPIRKLLEKALAYSHPEDSFVPELLRLLEKERDRVQE